MPTSNGQVGRFDIRQDAVHTIHVVDDAIETAKIPDLAVTFPDKIDDPFWSYVFESNLGLNPTLTTTYTEVASASIDIPAWVDNVTVLAFGQWQMANSSGGAVNLQVSTRVEDADDGARAQTVANNETGLCLHMDEASLVGVAGSTISVGVYVSVNSGTNSTNNGAVWGQVVGTR